MSEDHFNDAGAQQSHQGLDRTGSATDWSVRQPMETASADYHTTLQSSFGRSRNDLISERHNQGFSFRVVEPRRGVEGDQHLDCPRQDGNQEEAQQEAEPKGGAPNGVAVPPERVE